MTDKIKGGLADSKSLQDIADKHSVSLSAIESALADGIKVESEHTSDVAVATEIAKDHLFEDAEYYSKLANMEKQNSKDWAKTYKASNFIEKGVCTYNDETIYLSQEALNKAILSIKGRPVVIKHQKVTPQNMEDHAVGYVSDCGFCSDTAAFYCNFLVFDDEGKEVIAKDYSVSCAYIPKAFGKGGTWHNTPYDREVTELEFTHLALVPDPRYEDAKIYENAMDSEEGRWITIKGNKIFVKNGEKPQETFKKWLSNLSNEDYKKAKEKGTVKEFDINIDDEFSLSVKGKMKDLKVIEIIDGGTIKLSDNNKYKVTYTGTLEKITEKQNSTDNTTKETYNMDKIEVEQGFLTSLLALVQQPFLNAKEDKKEEPKEKEDAKVDDDEMEYEGKKYSKKELVNTFEAGCAGKKAEEEKEKTNAVEEEVVEVVEQSTDDDMEFFNSMQKLMATAQTDANDKVEVHSQNKGLELGSKAFG